MISKAGARDATSTSPTHQAHRAGATLCLSHKLDSQALT
jgi:hypothetical protein